MKRTIRVTIDVELSEDAFEPFGATSSDQEHVYFEAACLKVADAVSSAYQTQAARGRYVCSEFLHDSRKPVMTARPPRMEQVARLLEMYGTSENAVKRDLFVDALSPAVHREIARGFIDDVCMEHPLPPTQSLRCLLEVPIPASLQLIRAIDSAWEKTCQVNEVAA
jgi:hypothetical protein